MSMVTFLFYLMAAVAIGSALYVAYSKNLVRSIFMFFVTLFALAGLYVVALADFVAVTQIVIYVGGILVLILFAFMLSGKETLEVASKQKTKIINIDKVPAFLLAASFFAMLAYVLYNSHADNFAWVTKAVQGNREIKPEDVMINNIGVNLMTSYLLPFEAISILLMIALVGAAHLSRKEPKNI